MSTSQIIFLRWLKTSFILMSTFIVTSVLFLLVASSSDVFTVSIINTIRMFMMSERSCHRIIGQVAIIIPFRDREDHKLRFLSHIHPFLQRQMISYQIFMIDQVDNKTFNRGKLLNIGYTEAKKMWEGRINFADLRFTCFIFHDVDLLPVNDQLFYNCSKRGPMHLAVAQDRYNWKLLYQKYCGGAIALTDHQMILTNGFSNNYWGWGGEDNDFGIRINLSGQTLQRESNIISSYATLGHGRDKTNPKNKDRFNLLKNVSKIWKEDGLNNLRYKIVNSISTSLYHYLAVESMK